MTIERGLQLPTDISTPESITNSFTNKDILSLEQFSPESLEHLFEITFFMKDIGENARPSDILSGNLATLLFYEPSSRTRGSFDAAVKQLGGQTVVVENPQQFSSVSKGETFDDTIRTFESYCDTIVLRHPEAGKAQEAADVAKHVPIINAGDGVGEHPTQALLDLFTIQERTGKLDNLIGVFAGDIKNGRTIHSLLRGLSLFPGNEAYLLSPEELRLPHEEILKFKNKGLSITEISLMNEIPKNANYWYWTRVQKERFQNHEDYDRLNNKFVVTKENFDRLAGRETILMHPLPRVGEIETEIDEDSRAVYLRSQVRNGMYVRMALLSLVLGKIK